MAAYSPYTTETKLSDFEELKKEMEGIHGETTLPINSVTSGSGNETNKDIFCNLVLPAPTIGKHTGGHVQPEKIQISAHSPRLIRLFTGCILDNQGCKVSSVLMLRPSTPISSIICLDRLLSL